MAEHIIIPQEIPKEYPTIKFGGYDWLVLDEQDGKKFIVTKKVIDSKPYHQPTKSGNIKVKTTWEEGYLRKYLNNVFYNSFNEDEKARIQKT